MKITTVPNAYEDDTIDRIRPNPHGRYPVCMNALGSMTCARCGRQIQGDDGPCPAFSSEERWGPDWVAEEKPGGLKP